MVVCPTRLLLLLLLLLLNFLSDLCPNIHYWNIYHASEYIGKKCTMRNLVLSFAESCEWVRLQFVSKGRIQSYFKLDVLFNRGCSHIGQQVPGPIISKLNNTKYIVANIRLIIIYVFLSVTFALLWLYLFLFYLNQITKWEIIRKQISLAAVVNIKKFVFLQICRDIEKSCNAPQLINVGTRGDMWKTNSLTQQKHHRPRRRKEYHIESRASLAQLVRCESDAFNDSPLQMFA